MKKGGEWLTTAPIKNRLASAERSPDSAALTAPACQVAGRARLFVFNADAAENDGESLFDLLDRRAETAAYLPLLRSAAISDVRGLLGRSRRPQVRGHTSSVPRHGLPCVGCLKQEPKPVCQLFDGLPQGAELPNPDYRDGSVQVKRWGTQYFHGIDRMIPGNKASG